MRLAGFNYSTPAIYYITVCTQNREPILWTSETINISVGNSERQILKPELSEIGLITEEFIRQIPGLEKYVIMPNHVHMIMERRSSEFGVRSSESCRGGETQSRRTAVRSEE